MKTISLIRLIALAALGIAAFLGIFSETSDDGMLVSIIITKFVGFAAAWAFIRLFRRWRVSDPLIVAIGSWCEDSGEDRPNPLKDE